MPLPSNILPVTLGHMVDSAWWFGQRRDTVAIVLASVSLIHDQSQFDGGISPILNCGWAGFRLDVLGRGNGDRIRARMG